MLKRYYIIEKKLSKDSVESLKDDSDLLIADAPAIHDKELSSNLQKYAQSLSVMISDGSHPASLDHARDSFKKLSQTLADYLTKHPQAGWSLYHCPTIKTAWV